MTETEVLYLHTERRIPACWECDVWRPLAHPRHGHAPFRQEQGRFHDLDLNFRNVQRLCAGVDLSVERPTIDLTGITWIEPYAIVYLGMFLRYHNSLGKYFTLNVPDAKASQYLNKQNFWNRFNFNLDAQLDRQLLRQNTSFNDIIDLERDRFLVENLAERLFELLEGRAVNLAIEDSVIAITDLADNFVQHSGVVLGAMMVQYYPTNKVMRVALGDCGNGIKGTLARSGKYPEVVDMSHADAIAFAFRPMITCKNEGGTGLCDVLDTMTRHSGTLFLTSQDGGFFLDRDGKIYSGKAAFALPGVQVELTFFER